MNRKNILLASLAACTLGLFAWANAHSSPAQQEYFAVNSSGVSEAALRGAIDPLFEEASMGETRALLVMKDGEIIAERYGAGFDSESRRSEEHTSELQSLMRISYAVFCLKKKKKTNQM